MKGDTKCRKWGGLGWLGTLKVTGHISIEQLYSPREVAYNNIEQYKQKQDRTNRTEKRSRATCVM